MTVIHSHNVNKKARLTQR